MAEKLRLHTGSRFKVRLHPVVFAVILLVCLLLGFIAGQKGLIVGKATVNCIPQKDFQYFLDKANDLQADYKKCVADLWSLQFSIKTGGKITPSGEPVITNSTN